MSKNDAVQQLKSIFGFGGIPVIAKRARPLTICTLLIPLLVVMTACGGGGSGSGGGGEEPDGPINLRPVAVTGESRVVNPGEFVILDGSASHDGDGEVVAHAWEQIAGPAASLSGADSLTLQFQVPDAGQNSVTQTFRLTVTDNMGAQGSTSVHITVPAIQGSRSWVETGSLQVNYPGTALAVGALEISPATGLVVFSGPSWSNQAFDCLPQAVVAVSVDAEGALAPGDVHLNTAAQPVHAREIIVADFNGDGRPDILSGNHGCDNIFLTDGEGFPGERNTLLMNEGGALIGRDARLPQFNGFTHSVTAADIRKVGRSDVLIGLLGLSRDPDADASYLNRGNTPHKDQPYFGAYLLRGNADGTLSYDTESLPDRVAKPTLGGGEIGRFTAALLADLNGDDYPDLIVGTDGNAPVAGYVFLNDGNGGFRTAEIPLPVGAFGPYKTIVADIQVVDLDLDGQPEVVLAVTTNEPFYASERMQVLRFDSVAFTDVTEEVISFGERQGWTQFLNFVDLNGDGCPEMVMYKDQPRPEDVLIYECRDGRLEPAAALPEQSHGLHPLRLGDRIFLTSVRAVLHEEGPTRSVKAYEYRLNAQ
jgi:hypothetical protein